MWGGIAVGSGTLTGVDGYAEALADRGRRLFEFLAQAQALRSSVLKRTAQYEDVIWLADLPEHSSVRSTIQTDEAPEADAPVAGIRRVPREPVPEIPASLRGWIDPANTVDPEERPQAEEFLWQRPVGSDEPVRAVFGEDPERLRAFREWLDVWQIWADRELEDNAARALYERLFTIHRKVADSPEEFEVVLGVGLVAWDPKASDKVARHILTCPVAITFDEATGYIGVDAAPAAEALNLELDMFEPGDLPSSSTLADLKNDAALAAFHPLDRAEIALLVHRFMNSLDSTASYVDQDEPVTASEFPRSAFAPAIILRKRGGRGLVDLLSTIAQRIATTQVVPEGLMPLLDPNFEPAAAPDPTPGAAVTLGDDGLIAGVDGDPGDVFVPLPLNDKQLQILRHVDRHAQTLVQGPPGTGKTHTAAALLSHLLAQGKRVLVTAEAERALTEVRGKLPEGIQQLAVSVVGSNRAELADLKVAVERIASASGDWDAEGATRRIDRAINRIDDLRRERARLVNALTTAREAEVTAQECGPYAGSLAFIAQRYLEDSQRFEWIVPFVATSDGNGSPLGSGDALRWLELVGDDAVAADEREALMRLVEPRALPAPDNFAEAVRAERRSIETTQRRGALLAHPDFPRIRALGDAERAHIAQEASAIATTLQALRRRDDQWTLAALSDVFGGRAQDWTDRRQQLDQDVSALVELLSQVGSQTEVAISADADRGRIVVLCEALIDHLDQGGTIKTAPDGTPKVGAFSPKPVKASAALFAAARVDGRVPVTKKQLQALWVHIEAERRLDLIDRAWPAYVHPEHEDTLRERMQWHRTEVDHLSQMLDLASRSCLMDAYLTQRGIAARTWLDEADISTLVDLVAATYDVDAADQATAELAALEALCRDAVGWGDAAHAVEQLKDAITARDLPGYRDAVARLVWLHDVRRLVAERDDLTARVTATSPSLAVAVMADRANPIWAERLGSITDAWQWSSTGTWLRSQRTENPNVLRGQLTSVEQHIRALVAEVAEQRAWNHAVARLDGQARADLRQYAQLVKSLGKGTGKYAAQRRADIRRAMQRCSSSVPVWIMPLFRVAEQLRVEENMFDIVIVDEASQAGLEATFLQYLAPKIIVIGDDKQVSPAAVGIDQQQLRDLARQYLRDDRYLDTWQDPKRSLFDEANMRFGSKITLIEHRRCVPEIIGFSNRIAYEPDNIRLTPVRQYGADRLAPIKPVFLEDGYERRGVNPVEVEAIVDQITKCLADPAYDGKTFGVIALRGGGQAKAIHNALLEAITHEEWEARQLRCGEAPEFQGSERDVVFLSMVTAAEEGERIAALTAEMYLQRYNVAVSRARDQLWVFHSVPQSRLSNTQDMRYQLLDYCHGVVRRGQPESGASAERVSEDRPVEPFDSLFEQRVFNALIDRGHVVLPQFDASGYRIDLVVVGANGRAAVECDGDFWHGPEEYSRDLRRQRDLERCGWQFFRIRESAWYYDQAAVLADLWKFLDDLGIRAGDWSPEPADLTEEVQDSDATAEAAVELADRLSPEVPVAVGSVPEVQPAAERAPQAEERLAAPIEGHPPAASRSRALSLDAYRAFAERVPRIEASPHDEIRATLRRIVKTEGPVLGTRIERAYAEAAGVDGLDRQQRSLIAGLLQEGVRNEHLVAQSPLGWKAPSRQTYSLADQRLLIPRELGGRQLEEVPPEELAWILCGVAQDVGWAPRPVLFAATFELLGIDLAVTGDAYELLEEHVALAQIFARRAG